MMKSINKKDLETKLHRSRSDIHKIEQESFQLKNINTDLGKGLISMEKVGFHYIILPLLKCKRLFARHEISSVVPSFETYVQFL